MAVSPEPEAVELLRRYRIALNYVMNKILSLNLRTIKDAHRKLYRELREWFGLSSRIALIGMQLLMQRPGGGTLIRVEGPGLRRLACCCTRDQAQDHRLGQKV